MKDKSVINGGIALLVIIGIVNVTNRARPESKNVVFVMCLALVFLAFAAGQQAAEQRNKRNDKK